MRTLHRTLLLALAVALLASCGDDGVPGTSDVAADASDVAADAGLVDATDDPDADPGPGPDGGASDAAAEVFEEVGPPDPLAVRDPLGPAAADPLEGSDVTSCSLYQAVECGADNRLLRCDVYDTGAADFTDSPDPLLHRTLLFDRWYELHHAPDGQTANRNMAGETLAGTDEAIWGTVEHFGGWDAIGDTAIWSGAGMQAFALRYAVTGTAADLERLRHKSRQILGLFDVTGVPGYLARHHFMEIPDDAWVTDQHIVKKDSTFELGWRDHWASDEVVAAADSLPDAYRDGYTAPDGTVVKGPIGWHGHPSIDQYSGPLAAFTAAWPWLEDDVKARMTEHVTCYLKRLERMEIIGLDENPEASEALSALLTGANATLDDGDLDIGDLDRMVIYTLRNLNTENADTYPRACPDAIEMEPSRIIDAASDDFIAQALELYLDYDADEARTDGIDHYYAVNISGPHAVSLIWLGTLAYYMTGDTQYRDFVLDEVIGNLGALAAADLTGAFLLPNWCRKFFSDHILFVPFWNLLGLLEESTLRASLLAVFEVEMWQKTMFDLSNMQFDLIYAATVPEELATGREVALSRALADLELLGGNGGIIDDPRRRYTLDRTWLLDNLPEGVEAVCPTIDERAICEGGLTLFGLPLGGNDITGGCGGGPGECAFDDGECAAQMSSVGMPVEFRPYEGYMWEGHPFHIGRGFGVQGEQQAPGLDVIIPYWLARLYGFTDDGTGQVLAWRDIGACPD